MEHIVIAHMSPQGVESYLDRADLSGVAAASLELIDAADPLRGANEPDVGGSGASTQFRGKPRETCANDAASLSTIHYFINLYHT